MDKVDVSTEDNEVESYDGRGADERTLGQRRSNLYIKISTSRAGWIKLLKIEILICIWWKQPISKRTSFMKIGKSKLPITKLSPITRGGPI